MNNLLLLRYNQKLKVSFSILYKQKWIREHKEDYRGNRTGDLQDAYLEKIKEGCEGFSENGLSAMLRELFVIGAESESVLLRYLINSNINRKILKIILIFLCHIFYSRVFSLYLDGPFVFCLSIKMLSVKFKMKSTEWLEKEMLPGMIEKGKCRKKKKLKF